MTVEMWVGVGIFAWCVVSVAVGLFMGMVSKEPPPPAKPECLMCELERVSR